MLKKGALLQERCDDGTQPYDLLDSSQSSIKGSVGGRHSVVDRKLVEDQPEWFVEVFKVTPEYMTREELDKYKEFVKSGVKTTDKEVVNKPKISKRQIAIAKYAIKNGSKAAADKYGLAVGSIMTYRSLYRRSK